ncbi:MAG TPA: bacillithiol transferase BstA [Bryobacteraceae bacterium]|nr:bacillithiol transferase BstA [Bryobacteraceae bacterium]
MENEDLRYPVGKFHFPDSVTPEERSKFVEQIAEAPARLRAAVAGLNDAQLDTPYRPGGWTVRQVVHHVPDSHINSYTRFRLALTEDQPTIKPYEEGRWAELADARTAPIEVSLRLLECLHSRWVGLLRSLSGEQWKRTFRHPDLGLVTLDKNAALYAWHGRHHVAHITNLRDRKGWK